jgi:hypothetical protein
MVATVGATRTDGRGLTLTLATTSAHAVAPRRQVVTISPMGDSVYELTRSKRRDPLWIMVIWAAPAIFVFLTSSKDPALVVVLTLFCGPIVSILAYDLLRRPNRVTLTDAGAVMTSRTREVTIRWADLVSVTRVRVLGGHHMLEWRRVRGRVIKTYDEFTNVHHMLAELEHRAPHLHVSS